MRSMTFADFFRVLLLSKVIWGADFFSDIHFALKRVEMKSWSHRVIKGQWRHTTRKLFFELLTPKNHPWAFQNHRNVFYSSQETRWTLKFCSNSIRSKVVGDHVFSSLFGTWPDLRARFVGKSSRAQKKWQLTSCTSWEFIISLKPIFFQNFWAMSFRNHWLTTYQNIYSNIGFPKAVNKTCPCGVTIFTSHHKVITSSRLLQHKVITSSYIKVTVTLTNHRPFQNRPTLDAKKMNFC